LYMAPDGDDSASGAIDAPLATFPAAYARMEGGDTLYFRGGTYHVTDGQVMKYDKNYAYVFALEKAGTPGSKTCFMGYPGERPVFDFSALQLDGRHRFAAFYLGADNLHLRNFDIVGVPVRVLGHTQSECVAARKGSDCIVENIAMHDGMAIGYYQTAGSNNLVLNCDAYNNYDDYSEGAYGGNVDGFGFHLGSPEYTGNVIRNCRAWRNSDDGFDLINCKAPVEIDHCWAFYNGFKPTANPADTVTFESAGDGNGFKAGGYGMKPGKTKCPDIVPRYYIHHCVAYHNKANGLYSNHHLGGSRWENNSSWDNRGNYNMVNRKSEREVVDVPGYGHELTGNVSYTYADGMRSGHLVNCDMTRSSLVNNSFAPADSAVTVTGDMFVSVDPAELFLPRDADGNLPRINFLRAKTGSPIAARHQGWAAEE
ncbi:MAG: right-handed parallel beta-helix repeat-containing protein, partial [Duncaniella sp.]|nr:right-handed parallel beta-helix repeat-containing protein [Duncaniella sp.]